MILDCYKPTFARSFIRASSHALKNASAAATVTPITMACWFNSSDITVKQTLMSLGQDIDAVQFFQLCAQGATGGDPITAEASGGVASSASGYSANTWHHAVAVFASSTSRFAYKDGTAGTENTTNVTPTALANTTVGYTDLSGNFNFMSGMIAWPAIWNVALTGPEVLLLARGRHPTTIRPENLVAFWDWEGRDIEHGLRAAYPLTNTGSTPVMGPGFLSQRIARLHLLGAGVQLGHPAVKRMGGVNFAHSLGYGRW